MPSQSSTENLLTCCHTWRLSHAWQLQWFQTWQASRRQAFSIAIWLRLLLWATTPTKRYRSSVSFWQASSSWYLKRLWSTMRHSPSWRSLRQCYTTWPWQFASSLSLRYSSTSVISKIGSPWWTYTMRNCSTGCTKVRWLSTTKSRVSICREAKGRQFCSSTMQQTRFFRNSCHSALKMGYSTWARTPCTRKVSTPLKWWIK